MAGGSLNSGSINAGNLSFAPSAAGAALTAASLAVAPGSAGVRFQQNSATGSLNAGGQFVEAQTLSGSFSLGNVSASGGSVYGVAQGGSLSLNGSVASNGGDIMLVATAGDINGAGASLSSAGGDVAMIAESNLQVGPVSTGGGAAYLSASLSIDASAVTAGLGNVLATTLKGGATTQQFVDGSAITLSTSEILVARNAGNSVSTYADSSGFGGGNSSITPEQIPGGGFSVLTNAGTLTLTDSSSFSFNSLVPFVVRSGNPGSVGGGSQAKFALVSPELSSSISGLIVNVGNNIAIVSGPINFTRRNSLSLTGNNVDLGITDLMSVGGSVSITAAGNVLANGIDVSSNAGAGSISISAAGSVTTGFLGAVGGNGSISVSGNAVAIEGFAGASQNIINGNYNVNGALSQYSLAGGSITINSATTTFLAGGVASDGGAISLPSVNLTDVTFAYYGKAGGTVDLSTQDPSGNFNIGQLLFLSSGGTITINTTGSVTFTGSGAGTGVSGDTLNATAGSGITVSGNIFIPSGTVTLTANNGSSLSASGIDVSGAAGVSINLLADGSVTSGYLRAYGENGGAGGSVSVTSNNSFVTVGGDINAGGGWSASGAGGLGGTVSLSAASAIQVNGPIVALGGNEGAAGSQSVTLSGSSVRVTGTVASAFGQAATLPSGFVTSPYAGQSILTGSLTVSGAPGSGASPALGIAGGITSSGGTISISNFNLPSNSVSYSGSNGGTITLTTTASSGNITVGQLIDEFGQANFSVNTSGTFTFGGASVAGTITGANLNVTAAGGISSSGNIFLPQGSVNLTSTIQGGTGGSIVIQGVDVSGAGGASNAFGAGQPGGGGGGIVIGADGSVQTGYLRAYGGGGGASGWYVYSLLSGAGYDGGKGGDGGSIQVTSNGGMVTVGGDINVSGGGGGGGQDHGGAGGASGNITLAASGAVTVDGPIMAFGGGQVQAPLAKPRTIQRPTATPIHSRTRLVPAAVALAAAVAARLLAAAAAASMAVAVVTTTGGAVIT